MPVKARPIAPAIYNWTGLYVGVDAGYLWSSVGYYVPGAPTAGTVPGKPNSFNFGGHIGYLYQFNNPFVIGAEADVSWLNGSSTEAFPGAPTQGAIAKTKWDASLRAILGYAFNTNLIYATGGASWLNVEGCGVIIATAPTCVANTGYSNTRSGWTVGGGIAHAFTPNLSARVEYLYANYGNFDFTATGAAGGIANVSMKTNKVRGGLSWKF